MARLVKAGCRVIEAFQDHLVIEEMMVIQDVRDIRDREDQLLAPQVLWDHREYPDPRET